MAFSRIVLALAILVGSAVPHAAADPYPWCAVYSGDAGGASNCGFVTLAQCQATVNGIGGFCEPNQFYTGPVSSGPKARKPGRPK